MASPPHIPRTKPPVIDGGRQLVLLLAATLALGLGAASAQTGSVTAESVWNRRNAIQRAQSQLPAGARVTRTKCIDVSVRMGNDRYICTLDYEIPTPATIAPASTPSAPSAPAR